MSRNSKYIKMENEKNITTDGELYLSGSNPPPPPSYSDSDFEGSYNSDALFGEKIRYQLDNDRNADTTLYERVLFKTKDPTSPPHTREVCVKWCRVGPLKTCCGWKIQYRWLYVTCVIRVTTSTPANIKDAVEDCLKQAAVVAAITAVISGGTAAIAAAEAAMEACLLSKFGSNLLTVSIDLNHNRGPWE